MKRVVSTLIGFCIWASMTALAPALAQDLRPEREGFQMADLVRCLERAGDDAEKCIGVLSNECQMTPDGSTTQGIVACEQAETALWDSLLNDRYQAALIATKEREDSIREFVRESKALAALREAQRKWIAFRDAECQRVFEYYAGGTIRGPAFARCQLRLTAERAIDLSPKKFR